MNVYNRKLKLLTVVTRLQIEFLMSGKATYIQIIYNSIEVYKKNFELRLSFEIIFTLLLLYYILVEYKE